MNLRKRGAADYIKIIMSVESQNNKRIAKNTAYLYIRMILVMCVSFYTSRIVLKTLGVSDYGVYSVMGGIIGMLGYVNTLMSGATSRFLTIELGKGNIEELRRTFSMSNTLCLTSAGIFLLLGETVGLWFMNTQLNITIDRIGAANWVYQCALLSAVVTVLQSPYTASVIAHEKMSVYAYMSIFDVVMKLLIVFALLFFEYDKLILYAILLFIVNLLNAIIYRVYCSRKFSECNISFCCDIKKFKEMFSYSGWNMIIVFASMLNNYGLNILLNIFYGTVVNAARGLALQVNMITNQLYTNFQTASRPQVLKYYAQGNIDAMSNLIINTSKFSGYLLLSLIIPVCFNIDGLLSIWLDEVPEYTSWFVRLIMISSLFSAIDHPVGMGIQAVGKMKLPNLTVSILYLSVFPLGYFAMKIGFGPIASYAVYLCVAPIILIVDLLILRKYTGFCIKKFINQALCPMSITVAVSMLVPIYISLNFKQDSPLSILIQTIIGGIYVCFVLFYLGLPKEVRTQIIAKLKNRL